MTSRSGPGPDPVRPPSLHLEQLTWPEVQEALAAGWTRVLLPVGAVEQHGHHLPLAVDAERGTATGEAIAGELGQCLVAPTIRVGCSDHHMGFPGTLSIRPETLEHLCVDYVSSLSAHGFDTILLFPSHGGNFAPLKEMLPRLRSAAAPGARVVAYTDLSGFLEIWRDAITRAGGDPSGVGGHAGLAETSEMLEIRPDLVRMDRALAGVPGPPSQEVLVRVFRDGFRAVTPVGVLGDPTGASALLGRACLDAVARTVAEEFRRSLAESSPQDRA